MNMNMFVIQKQVIYDMIQYRGRKRTNKL